MELRIENIPSEKIIFMRREGSYGAENIRLMEEFKNWVKAKNLWNENTVILGIAQDNPAHVHPEKCRYDVCLVSSQEEFLPEGKIHRGEMKAGKYAVFIIRHTQEAMQKAWKDIFQELLKCGYIADDSRPIVERYNNRLICQQQCEICVPIQ